MGVRERARTRPSLRRLKYRRSRAIRRRGPGAMPLPPLRNLVATQLNKGNSLLPLTRLERVEEPVGRSR